ncbi:unnamed protein product [Boreogadus saida]
MATGEDRRELVEVRKKAELGLLDVAVTPTSKCGKGQRRKIPNSKNLEPSEDGNDEHVAEPKTKSKRTKCQQKYFAEVQKCTKYMATHSVSGLSSTKAANVKAALPRDHVMEIIAEARKVFPGAAEADIRRFKREKLSNAAKVLRRKEKSDRT